MSADTQFLTAETSAPRKRERILELDAIRAISCLNLLLFHFTYVYTNKYGFTSPLAMTFPYGKYGVQLFFILSGFVNTMTLVGKRSTKDFVVARCIRIFPSYWLCILMNVLLFAYLPFFRQAPTMEATVANLSTMPRLFGFENMEPVTWTLQVEMLFYTFLLLMTMLGGWKHTLRNLTIGVAACWIFCTAFDNIWPDSSAPGPIKTLESLFIMRNFPLFAMGMLLNEIRNKRGRTLFHAIGILFAAAVFHAIDLRGHNPVATVLLFALVGFGAWGMIPPLRWKPLMFISTISYTLYLFHNNIGSACIYQLEQFGLGPYTSVIIATVLTIALGTATTIWFEQPITSFFRRRWKQYKTRKEIEGSAVTNMKASS
jgi:peptidoglycan/LPS O-acetylase OafA/YrhL